MEGYGPETYGERIAEVYDDLFHPPTSAEDTVEFLAGLAGGGPALELAIGTGRIALPLAARASRSTVSTLLRPWSPSSAPSQAAMTSR